MYKTFPNLPETMLDGRVPKLANLIGQRNKQTGLPALVESHLND